MTAGNRVDRREDHRVRIGVMALQGAFQLHEAHLRAVGAEYVEVVTDFTDIDGLILPGGESGAMLKMIDDLKIARQLSEFVKTKPVWGICAGAILLAHRVTHPEQMSFDAINVVVERNAYGRQLDSLEDDVDGYRVAFIRAPKIRDVGVDVAVKSVRDRDAIWVEAGRVMATTFHPEVNRNVPSPWHRRFAESVRQDTR